MGYKCELYVMSLVYCPYMYIQTFSRDRTKTLFQKFAWSVALIGIIFFIGARVAHANFAGGSGTADDPYQITTCAQFEALSNADGYYVLKNDIDCTSEGNAMSLRHLSASFDGEGHKVTIATTDGQGLFHELAGGTFKNTWIAGTVSGTDNGYGLTGAIANLSTSGTILNVKNTVNITSATGAIGGFIGGISSESTLISNSYFDGTITATGTNQILGAIVGTNAGIIQDCYSIGTITAMGANATIGGIWGASSVSHGTATNDFSAMTMSSSGGNATIGGLFGTTGHTYSNNFWDVSMTGQPQCIGSGSVTDCIPENTDGTHSGYFKNNTGNGPFPLWDFVHTWRTVVGGYPELQLFDPIVTISATTPVSVTILLKDIPGNTQPSVSAPVVSDCTTGEHFSVTTGQACPQLLITPGAELVHTFTKNLHTGSNDPQVALLEHYLNTHAFPVSLSGLGSLGKETDTFGAKTMSALARFQASIGIPATGYLGEKTRAYINSHV